MRTITVFYDGSHYIYRWLKPLFAASKCFKKHGVKVNYPMLVQYLPLFKKGEKWNLDKALHGHYDIVFMAFHHSTSHLCNCNESERADILRRIKENCNMLVWLDTADSTGCCLFDVMPYVDKYLKKQLLVDRSSYARKMYGGRLFCEYYHEKLKVEDDQLSKEYPVLNQEYEGKLGVSWNVGVGDLFAKGVKLILRPKSCVSPKYISPFDSNKKMDLHFRGSGWSPIAGYQRSLCKKLVDEMDDVSHPDVNGKVPYEEYVREIQSAKMVISPFGWGEICTRDFEAFVNGAALIKPNMSHCETWPNWFVENETYIPMDWDFESLSHIIEEYKNNAAKFESIATRGQEMYMKYRESSEAKELFVKHVLGELGL